MPLSGQFLKAQALPFDARTAWDDPTGPWGPRNPDATLALAGMREAPWKVALVLTVALVGWTALFAVGVGCVWVGWMIADWVGV